MYIYASLFCIYQKKYVFLTETRTFNFHDPLFSFFHLYKKRLSLHPQLHALLPVLSFLEGSRTNRELLVPSESFLNSLPTETFYEIYHRSFPAGS